MAGERPVPASVPERWGALLRRGRPFGLAVAAEHVGAAQRHSPGAGDRGGRHDGRGALCHDGAHLGARREQAGHSAHALPAAGGSARGGTAARQQRERQERRGLPPQARERRHQLHAELARLAPADVAAARVAGQPAHLALVAESLRHAPHHAAHRDAAPPLGDVGVLALEPPAGAEQRALHRRLGELEPLGDLPVGEPLELAQHENPCVDVGQLVEGAAQVLEALLLDQHRVGPGGARQPDAVGLAEPLVLIDRDLLGSARAAPVVDSRVAGDLEDPRLEGDLGVGRAHPPQRREERVLGDVLGTGRVAHHPPHVGGDPRPIAAVQLLEGDVVARSDRFHEVAIGALCTRRDHPCLSHPSREQVCTQEQRVLRRPSLRGGTSGR